MTRINDHTAICVLGMHRSGTSTITRAISLLGAYIGEEKDLMESKPDNPEGFWERLDIYHLQERLLSTIKSDWASSAPLPEKWHNTKEIRPFKEELVNLVKTNFSDHPLWVWKDPRTCLLLPLWKDVLSDLDMALKVVFVVRNPLDIAKSLKKRNGFTLDKGLGIWFNYTLAALKSLDGVEATFLSYDRFLSDWEPELKKCASALEMDWPADETILRARIDSFVRHDLRHSASGLDELHAAKAPEPVIGLCRLLMEILEAGKVDFATGRIADAMYQDFLGYARFFESDMVELADLRARPNAPPEPPNSFFARFFSRLKFC